MNKGKNLSLFFLVLFLVGCSSTDMPSQFLLLSNLPSHKINNLTDLSGDKRSELFFWNTSSMSKPNKFLEFCFFEVLDLAKNKHFLLKLGEVNDIPLVGYFDDDSIIDIGVYRSFNAGSSEWIIKSGVNENIYVTRLGETSDLPVPSDYDGDEKYDVFVYTPITSTFKGVLSRSQIPIEVTLGVKGDIPVPKDYDGDGKADFSTYRQRSGVWTIKKSSDGRISEAVLGGPYFLPIPGDYNGDGKCDLCAFNIFSKTVKLFFSGSGTNLPDETSKKIEKALENSDFFPVPLDYDADGRCELAFWSSSRKILLTFDLAENLRKKVYRFAKIRNSFPVNSFLIRNFALNNPAFGPVESANGEKSLFFLSSGEIISSHIPKQTKKVLTRGSILSKWSKGEDYIPFVADFDGDYVLDSCLWSTYTGAFLCMSSRVGWDFGLEIGEKSDKPVIGDFNGDNISDIGTYRSKGMIFYYRLLGKKSPEKIQLATLGEECGENGIPQIADYDGDNVHDLAVYNPDKKVFVVRKSSDLSEIKYEFCNQQNCDKSGVLPIACDFDGDSVADPGIVDTNRKSFSYFSTFYDEYVNVTFSGDLSGNVFCADLDLDLKSDLVFFKPKDSLLEVYESSLNFNSRILELPAYKNKDIKLANCPWLYNNFEL